MSLRPSVTGAAVALLLAGCVLAPPPPVATPVATTAQSIDSTASAAPACRDTVDGVTVTTDRGIGGTGIGGEPADPSRTADRGIGGTGISGSITGFGSVCVDGLEIAVDGSESVSVDGQPTGTATLHLGEIATIAAHGGGGTLRAVSLAIRHEVSGPIASVTATDDGQMLEVAGQRVLVDAATHAPAALRPGDWVSVSGLRDLAATIHASRIDPRAPGIVWVIGRPERIGGQWQIGALRLQLRGRAPVAGARMAVSGTLVQGVLRVVAARAERAIPESAPDEHLFVEGFADASGSRLRLAQGVSAAIAPQFGAAPRPDQPAIFEFVSDGHDNLLAVGWHDAAAGARSGGATHTENVPRQPKPLSPIMTSTPPAAVATDSSSTPATAIAAATAAAPVAASPADVTAPAGVTSGPTSASAAPASVGAPAAVPGLGDSGAGRTQGSSTSANPVQKATGPVPATNGSAAGTTGSGTSSGATATSAGPTSAGIAGTDGTTEGTSTHRPGTSTAGTTRAGTTQAGSSQSGATQGGATQGGTNQDGARGSSGGVIGRLHGTPGTSGGGGGAASVGGS